MRHPLPEDVLAAMQRNEKMEAIRLLRSRTSLGLAEAKDAVEAGYFDIADPHAAGIGLNPQAGSNGEPLAPGEVNQTSGNKSWLFVIAAVIAAAVWYRFRQA